jgi:hypothetical protein
MAVYLTLLQIEHPIAQPGSLSCRPFFCKSSEGKNGLLPKKEK